MVGHQRRRQVRPACRRGDRGCAGCPPARTAQPGPTSWRWGSVLHGVPVGDGRLAASLADDMGLGKTLQTLALLQHAKDVRGKRAFGALFIVRLTSVLSNAGAAEAHWFAPVPAIEMALRHELAAVRRHPHGCRSPGPDAVVTSYTPLQVASTFEAYGGHRRADPRRGAARQESPVQGLPVRAPGGRAFKAASPARRWSITNPSELWSLLSIAAPGLALEPDLGYCGTTTRGRLRSRHRRSEPGQQAAPQPDQAADRLGPRSRWPLDLPEKQEQVLEVIGPEAQEGAYQTHRNARAAGRSSACSTTSTTNLVHDPALADAASAGRCTPR